MTIETEAGKLVEKRLKQIGEEALQKAQTLMTGDDSKDLDSTLWQIGDKLEREALSKFKHNETWAVKGAIRDGMSSSYDKIKEQFQREVAEELTPEQLEKFPMQQVMDGLQDTIEEYLIGVTKLWQKESFDPLTTFRKKLGAQGRTEGTIKESLCVASRFVGKYGRKKHYSDTEITDFLFDEKERLAMNTYCTKIALLKTLRKKN